MAADEPVQPNGKPARTLRQRIWLLLLALLDVYTIPTAIFVILRVFTGYRLGSVAFTSNTLPWPLLPAIPLLAVLLVARRWKRESGNSP